MKTAESKGLLPVEDRGVPVALKPTLGIVAIAKYRGVSATRLAICRACDEFNGNLCERQFPSGCCTCSWARFLAGGVCPLGRWSPSADFAHLQL